MNHANVPQDQNHLPSQPRLCQHHYKSIPKTPTIAIWNVHEGVVYKAVPNNVGDGWHGYPTCEKSETGGVPKAIRRQLLNRAGEKMQRETKNWLQQRLIR